MSVTSNDFTESLESVGRNVNDAYCFCSFTGVFKDLQASFLSNSYFSMKFLVRTV